MKYTMAITIRFEEEVMKKLRDLAAKEYRSIGQVVRIAVSKMLKELEEGDEARS